MKQTKTLNDVCELIVDCEHKTAPTQATGYPSIRTPNIGRGRLILDNVNRVSEETYLAWAKRATPKAKDLILAREAPIGNVAIIPKNLKVCLGQRTVLIRPDRTQVDSNYLCYLLLGDEVQGKILGLSNGATVHHLNMKDIRNLELPEIPPISTQCKIAGILYAYDRLIENNIRRIKILEEMARSLYDEWFVKFRFPSYEQTEMVDSELGLIPKEWEVKKIKEIIKRLKAGRTYKEDNVSATGIVPVIDQSRNDFLGFHNNEPDHFASPEKPVIIFGDHTCKMRLMVEPFSVAPNVVPFLSHQGIPITYLYFLICNLVETKEYKRHWNELTNKTIFLAPTEYTRKFASYVKVIFEQIDCLLKKNLNLRRTRDLLLPKIISGEIDVENLDIETGIINESGAVSNSSQEAIAG